MEMATTMIEKMDQFADQMFTEAAGEWADYPRGVTPREEIWRAGNISLLEFEGEADVAGEAPILIIPSLINRWYIMDVTKETSYIQEFRKTHPVFLLDWGYPGAESSHLGLSHFYHNSIKRAVRQVKKRCGVESVNMIGYCIGGTLAYAYSCLEPADVEKLVLLATPLNFKDAGVLSDYANTFPAEEFLGSMEAMPGWMLAFSFQFIQPMGNLQKMKLFKRKFESDSFRELYVAMERWISDPVDFPARAYFELLTNLYRDNLLAEGKLHTANGTLVDPSKRTAEVLVLNADKDHIAPRPTTALPLDDKGEVTEITMPSGHIGITTGRSGPVARQHVLDFYKN
jgi:polyhydroxyalkanoate synthase